MRRAFDGDEGFLLVGDRKDAADGLAFFGMACATTDGAVNADDGDVHLERDAGGDGIRFVAGIKEERGAGARGFVDGFLENFFVGSGRVCW